MSRIRRTLKRALASGVMLALTTTAGGAVAAEPRGLDWGQALVDLDRYVRTGSTTPPAASLPASGTKETGVAKRVAESPSPKSNNSERPATGDDPSPQNMGSAWFGVAPRVTLVARDWASSTRLAGDRLSLVDAMRLSASTRMVVGRARLSGARFTPFVQVGLGQWRVDRNYLPLTPHSIEVAGQLGAGIELRLSKRWQLASETTVTTLIREGQSTFVPEATLWSTLVASRVEF